MISKIGIIYQDRNSRGFLEGLRDRLDCNAKLVEPPAAIGKPRRLTDKGAKWAWQYFQKQGVDLIVRFTDADRDRWQDVRRDELEVFPDQAQSICICGVAVENVEDWLCLDPDYISTNLTASRDELADPQNRVGYLKKALAASREGDEGQSDVVACIVRKAPPEVFRRWLGDRVLRKFYSDCRAAAKREGCETPNELDG